MEEDKIESSTIKKIGPIFKIEGVDFFLSPFQSRPLIGFNESEILKDEESFIVKIQTAAFEWFERFPDCCATHKKLKDFSNYNKNNYSFIPNQILNNVKYFAYALEIFIDKENWKDELSDYMDYLRESFGIPSIGGDIFDWALKGLIEGVALNNKKFTDDQRLELLELLEPKRPIKDLDDRDLEVLYNTFQKWVSAIPNFGKFKEFKEQFEGKIPLNIFLTQHRHNKYLIIQKFKSRSKEELLKYLLELTNEIIRISREEINIQNYHKNHFILAAEEQLRIRHDKLLNKSNSNTEIEYIELVENWLSIVIDFYKIINQVIAEPNKVIKNDKVLDVKNDCKTNIKNGNLIPAFDIMETFFQSKNMNAELNDVILLRARESELRKMQNKGLINISDYNFEYTKINYSLIELTNKL